MKTLLTILTTLFFLQNTHAQMTFAWRQISGPVQTQLVTPDSAICEATGLNVVGVYGYELSCTNAFGTGKDTTLITVIYGVLGIHQDSSYTITRPVIKKLEIKVMNRGSDIFMQIKSPRLQKITVIISDVIGRRIGKIEVEVKTGINTFSAPAPRIKGIYIIQFISYFESVTQRLII